MSTSTVEQDDSRPQQIEPYAFGRGSLLWDLVGDHRLNLVFLAGSLMQTMHPVIGDALTRSGITVADPVGRRLRSVDSVHLWIYGGEEALNESRRLVELHKPIKGRDTDGRDYSALRPEVWAWVPLTTYPAALTMCRRFGTPLTADQEQQLYDEVRNLARIFGVREQHIPATTADFWAYYDEMMSNRLVDHPYVHEVLEVAKHIPPPARTPRLLKPVWRAFAPAVGIPAVWLFTGTFPPEMRDILGLSWSARDERAFRLVARVIRSVAELTPEPWRYPLMPRLARRLAEAEAAGRPTAEIRAQLERQLAVMRARQTTSYA